MMLTVQLRTDLKTALTEDGVFTTASHHLIVLASYVTQDPQVCINGRYMCAIIHFTLTIGVPQVTGLTASAVSHTSITVQWNVSIHCIHVHS